MRASHREFSILILVWIISSVLGGIISPTLALAQSTVLREPASPQVTPTVGKPAVKGDPKPTVTLTPKKKRKKPEVKKPDPVESDESQTPAPSAPTGPKVVSMDVKGNRKIEKDAILLRAKSKIGEPFSADLVHDDVVSIFKMGYFYNIEVDKQDGSDGIKLTYTVLEKPSVNEIKYTGQSEVTEDDVKEASGLKPYEILSNSKIQTAIDKLTKLYEDKGYFLVRIKSRIEDIVPGESVRLVFDIKENEKVKVKKVTYLGIHQIKEGELKSVMETSEEGYFSFVSGKGSYKQESFDRDVQRMQLLYFNKGYWQVKISRPEVYVTPDKKSIFITIRVEEGDQFNVGEVDFAGDLLFSKEELRGSMQLKTGDVASYEILQADLQTLQAKYGDLGYAFANIIPRNQIREKERLVDLTFDIEKGNKVYFGDFTMVGNTKTRDKVIRREMRVREGELYNETRKRESLANVKRLGYFEDVNFNQKTPPDSPDTLNMDVVVKERNTGSIQVGAGYSSFNGMVFNGAVQQSNLFGKGQKLGLSIDLSSRASLFNLNFTEPYVLDTEWSAGFDLYKSQRQLLPYNESRQGGALRLGHPLGVPYLFGSLRYRNDWTELSLNDNVDPNIYPVGTANGLTSSVTGILEFDKRNDRTIPTDGVYLSTSMEYAGLGGNNLFTKGLATGRYYHKIIWDLVFRNNLTFGFISAPGNRLPPFNELFLLGGANTLRGFTWYSIGRQKYDSVNKRLVPYGGTQQVVYNGEIEFPLITEAGIKGVIFYDMGNADDMLVFSELRSDVGFGIRWFSPIGPLRFEWGFPINRKNDESQTNFEFAIGSPF